MSPAGRFSLYPNRRTNAGRRNHVLAEPGRNVTHKGGIFPLLRVVRLEPANVRLATTTQLDDPTSSAPVLLPLRDGEDLGGDTGRTNRIKLEHASLRRRVSTCAERVRTSICKTCVRREPCSENLRHARTLRTATSPALAWKSVPRMPARGLADDGATPEENE